MDLLGAAEILRATGTGAITMAMEADNARSPPGAVAVEAGTAGSRHLAFRPEADGEEAREEAVAAGSGAGVAAMRIDPCRVRARRHGIATGCDGPANWIGC